MSDSVARNLLRRQEEVSVMVFCKTKRETVARKLAVRFQKCKTAAHYAAWRCNSYRPVCRVLWQRKDFLSGPHKRLLARNMHWAGDCPPADRAPRTARGGRA